MSGMIRIVPAARVCPVGGSPAALERPAFDPQQNRPVLVSGTGGEAVCELPGRLKLSELLNRCGAQPDQIRAVYLGWPAGRFFLCEPNRELELDCETIYLAGQDACMVDLLAKLALDMRSAACGRCVFGREGAYQLHLTLSDIAAKKGRSTDLARMTELCEAMVTQCACTLGRAAGSSILSALALFGSEIDAHITKKVCPAVVCRPYISYYIDPDLCTGCQACADCCEEEAIAGRKGFIHVLDRTLCEACGQCRSECPEGAIKAASEGLPRLPAKPVACGAWR